MAKKTVYRDSGSGQFIKKTTAAKQNPRTWEKEHVSVGKK
jgi:hypothetical protein